MLTPPMTTRLTSTVQKVPFLVFWYALIRQGIFPLKVCSEHHRSSLPFSFPLNRLIVVGPHPGVQSTCRDQLPVGALLRHPATLQNQDLVRAHYRGESVGDHDDGAVLRQPCEGFLYQRLISGSGKGRGLIQHYR